MSYNSWVKSILINNKDTINIIWLKMNMQKDHVLGKQIAKTLEWSEQTVSRKLSGESKLYKSDVYALCYAFGWDPPHYCNINQHPKAYDEGHKDGARDIIPHVISLVNKGLTKDEIIKALGLSDI